MFFSKIEKRPDEHETNLHNSHIFGANKTKFSIQGPYYLWNQHTRGQGFIGSHFREKNYCMQINMNQQSFFAHLLYAHKHVPMLNYTELWCQKITGSSNIVSDDLHSLIGTFISMVTVQSGYFTTPKKEFAHFSMILLLSNDPFQVAKASSKVFFCLFNSQYYSIVYLWTFL